MNDEESGGTFWLGNLVLAVAMIMLFYMNTLWEMMGGLAIIVWIGVVAAGTYLLMNKKKGPPFS